MILVKFRLSLLCHQQKLYALHDLMTVATAIWFTWGGVRDIRLLFQRLRAQRVNPPDDRTVVNDQNLDEQSLSKTF